MWYQFSQDDVYLLIEGLACLRTAKFSQIKEMPCFFDQIKRDLASIEYLEKKLYDDGTMQMPDEPGIMKW